MIFECWGLPTKRFIDTFKDTFLEESILVISPETGSEEIRRLNKGFFYTNKELIETMEYISRNKLKMELYFTSGLPFERKVNFFEAISLIKYLRSRFDFKLSAHPIELEPGSPIFLNPERFGVYIKRKTIQEFLQNDNFSLGYATKFLSEKEIIANIHKLKGL